MDPQVANGFGKSIRQDKSNQIDLPNRQSKFESPNRPAYWIWQIDPPNGFGKSIRLMDLAN
jgi:hypothetical protein